MGSYPSVGRQQQQTQGLNFFSDVQSLYPRANPTTPTSSCADRGCLSSPAQQKPLSQLSMQPWIFNTVLAAPSALYHNTPLMTALCRQVLRAILVPWCNLIVAITLHYPENACLIAPHLLDISLELRSLLWNINEIRATKFWRKGGSKLKSWWYWLPKKN